MAFAFVRSLTISALAPRYVSTDTKFDEMKSVVQGKNWLRMVSFVQPSLPASRLACHFLSAPSKLTPPRLCYLLLDRPSTTDPTSPRLPSRHQQKSPSCYEGRTSCFLTRSRSTICRWRGWRTLWYVRTLLMFFLSRSARIIHQRDGLMPASSSQLPPVASSFSLLPRSNTTTSAPSPEQPSPTTSALSKLPPCPFSASRLVLPSCARPPTVFFSL